MAKTKRKKKRTTSETGRGSADRPTDERRRRGEWADPQGSMKAAQPTVDMASDAVGQLLSKGLISGGQEQAARLFQALRADYIAELPDVSGYKSCIAGSIPGFDDGDGDADIIARYRGLEKIIGRDRPIVLEVCIEGRIPTLPRLRLFRSALDRIAGVDHRKKIV